MLTTWWYLLIYKYSLKNIVQSYQLKIWPADQIFRYCVCVCVCECKYSALFFHSLHRNVSLFYSSLCQPICHFGKYKVMKYVKYNPKYFHKGTLTKDICVKYQLQDLSLLISPFQSDRIHSSRNCATIARLLYPRSSSSINNLRSSHWKWKWNCWVYMKCWRWFKIKIRFSKRFYLYVGRRDVCVYIHEYGYIYIYYDVNLGFVKTNTK